MTDERTSVWKRDLSFGRKRRNENAAPDGSEAVVNNEPETYAAEPAAADSREKKPSIWKREIGRGKRRSDDGAVAGEPEVTFDEPVADSWATPPAVPAAVEEQATEDAVSPEPSDDRPSIWKRDLSFGRKAKSADRDWEFDEAAQVEPAPVAESSVDVEPELYTDPSPSPAPQVEPVPEYESMPAYEPATWPTPSDVVPTDPEPVSAWPEPVAESFAPEPVAEPEPAFEPVFESEPVAEPIEEPAAFEMSDDGDFDLPEAPSKRKRTKRSERPKKTKTPKAAKAPKAPKASKGGRKLVGLKIGASQISAAHVQSNGSFEVLKLARTPLERGIVAAGELRDPDALAAALRTFFSENKLPKRDIRLGIASNRVGVRVLDVTGVEDPKLLGNAVRFRAQEVLPIPLTEAVLDYRVLRERVEEDGTVTHEVLVAFAYRELVDRYASVCKAAGLKLMGIDLDGFALLRALVDPGSVNAQLGGAAVVTVSLGHDRSIMSVSDGTTCEFTRVIEWGGATLDAAVARILALTPSQAEPIKRALTLDRHAAPPEGLSADQATRARAAMVQEVHAFAREFVSSLQFYQAQPRSLDIGEIVVTGGTAHMPGLVEQLQELIGVAVRIGDPLARVKVAKNVDTEESIGSLALAIGLGIED